MMAFLPYYATVGPWHRVGNLILQARSFAITGQFLSGNEVLVLRAVSCNTTGMIGVLARDSSTGY
jgi:hypothetical protein